MYYIVRIRLLLKISVYIFVFVLIYVVRLFWKKEENEYYKKLDCILCNYFNLCWLYMYYYKYLIELWFIFFIGGIVDIIVYYKVDDGFLEEMREVSGGLWGGKFVDDAFEMFIEDIIGKELMK